MASPRQPRPFAPTEAVVADATLAVRGMLRYRNVNATKLLAILTTALDLAATTMQSDCDTLGCIAMVDPEFEHLWNERMTLRREAAFQAAVTADIVRTATKRAIAELQSQPPVPMDPTHAERPRTEGPDPREGEPRRARGSQRPAPEKRRD